MDGRQTDRPCWSWPWEAHRACSGLGAGWLALAGLGGSWSTHILAPPARDLLPPGLSWLLGTGLPGSLAGLAAHFSNSVFLSSLSAGKPRLFMVRASRQSHGLAGCRLESRICLAQANCHRLNVWSESDDKCQPPGCMKHQGRGPL